MADDGALVEPLALDIQPALDALEPLGEKLSELATGFVDQLSEALGSIGQESAPVVVTADTTELDAGIADALDAPRPPVDVEADTNELTDSITEAVIDAPVDPVLVDGDTSELDDAIQSSVEQPVPPLTITADTSDVGTEIDAATSNIDATVAVNADVTELQDTLGNITTTPVEIQVEADTTDAQDQIDALGESATGAIGGGGGSGGGGGGSGIEGLAGVVGNFANVTPVAEGETQGLVASIAGLSPATAAAAGGVVALGAFIGDVTEQAAQAQAQTNRFNETFGALASQIEHINVGGLNITLKQLGDQSATSSTQLDSAASTIGEMGKSAGATGPKIVSTTTGILALAGAASVTNPQLGNTADVTERLSRLLQSGGPRLSAYGISLSASAVRAEALRENIGKTAAQLTPFDKLVAGTTLALAQQGDTLGTKFAAGAKNAQIELRSLKVELDDTLTAVGGPLLQPLVGSLKQVLPVAETLGETLGNLARVVFPLLGAAAGVIGIVVRPLALVSDGLHAIGTAITAIPEPVLIGIAAGFTAIGAGILVMVDALTTLDIAFPELGAFQLAILGVTAAIGVLGGIVDIFGNHAHLAAVDTSALDQTLLQTSTTADGTTGALDGLTQSVDKYLHAQLQTQVAGKSELETANAIGLSQKTLAAALSGTTAQYDAVTQKIKDSEKATVDATTAATQQNDGIGENAIIRAKGTDTINDETKSYQNLLNTLDKGRQKLEDNAQFTLNDAVSTGALTQAQLKAAEAASEAGGKTADYLTILTHFAPQINLFNAQTQATALAASESSHAFEKLIPQIASGAVTTNDATDLSTKLGLSVQDTTKFINDETQAVVAAKDKQLLAGDSVKSLAEQFQTGAITAGTLEARLVGLGVSVGGADGLVQQLQTNVVSLTVAQDRAVASTLRMQPGYEALVNQLANGTISEQQAQAGFEHLGLSISAAGTLVTNLKSTIASAVSSIVGNLPQASTAAAQWSTDIGNAFQKAQQDAQSGTGNISADLKALADSKDPQRFFDNLVKQSEQIAGFEGNIKKLIKEGLGNIGGFLAQQPIDVAAPLAAAIASDPSKAKTRAAVFALAQQISGPQATKFFTDHAEQLGLDVGTELGNGIIIPATTSVDAAAKLVASRFKPDFKGAITPQIRAAATALQNDPTITQAAGEKGLKVAEGLGNAGGVGEAVTLALRVAHDAVQNDPTLPAAAGQKGAETTAAYKSKTDIKGAATDAVTAAAVALPALSNLPNQAGLLGVATGEAFAQGMANGLGNQTQVGAVQDASAALADLVVTTVKTRHKTKSPSRVAIALGQQFSAGLGIGITDGGSLVAAAGTQVADDLVAQLKAALAAAGTGTGGTTNQAVDQLFSSASGALGSVGASISKFSSDLTNAQQKRVQAATAEHKLDVTLGRDQTDQAKLLKETGIAYGVLSVAQEQYNALAGTTNAVVQSSTAARDAAKKQLTEATNALSGFKTVQQETSTEATTALQTLNAAKTKYDSLSSSSTRSSSGVSKQALTDAKNALHDAQSTFDHFNNQLDSATKKTASALQRVQDAARGLKQAQHQLDVASDPGTFTRNLNAQTAAGNKFAKDLAKLNREGFTDLAKQLAAEGPEVAGALAAGFAKSSAKAKAAESAIDHANQFATSYQATLEKLFGQGSAAVTAAGLVGSATGAALVQGLKVTVGQGVGQVAGQVAQQLGDVKITPKLDLTPAARIPLGAPQKAIPPVAFGTPVQLLPLGGTAVAQGPQTITMDLTINLEDGRTVHAQAEVPLPQAPSLASRVVAEVNAS